MWYKDGVCGKGGHRQGDNNAVNRAQNTFVFQLFFEIMNFIFAWSEMSMIIFIFKVETFLPRKCRVPRRGRAHRKLRDHMRRENRCPKEC